MRVQGAQDGLLAAQRPCGTQQGRSAVLARAFSCCIGQAQQLPGQAQAAGQGLMDDACLGSGDGAQLLGLRHQGRATLTGLVHATAHRRQ